MSLNDAMMESVGALLRLTADTVVMPRFAKLQPDDTEFKSVGEPVTIADREAEAMIGRALLHLLPQARIVGEEACATDPSLIENLDKGYVWIIDPIDGTANFAAGRAPFALMVALISNGETIGSWILDPLSGRLCVAELGSGAWIVSERVQTSTALTDLASLHGILSESFVPAGGQRLIDKVRRAVGRADKTARCAGHEYPLVASGARQFALYWRTLAWDHLPGALFLTEAGGTVSHLDGTNYRPASRQSGLLLAHNSLVHSKLLSLIKDLA